MQKSTLTLTDEQVAFYQQQGYLSIPAITSAEEIEQVRQIYDRLFAAKAGREEGNQFEQHQQRSSDPRS